MLDNILKLQSKFDVFMFDLYGVIWNGIDLINQSNETLKQLKANGKKVVLLSNSVSRSFEVEDRYSKLGIIKGIHYDSFVTSGELAYDYFSNDKADYKYYFFGKPNPSLFKDSKYKEVKNVKDADFIYAGSPYVKDGDKYNFVTSLEPFQEELKRIVKLNKPMICVNPDLRTPSDSFVREGAVAIYYEEIGGEVEYIGKPYPEVYDFALKDCDVEDDRILMVGDTLETDILGANSYGIKSALVSTGISHENMIEEGFDNIKEYAKEVGIEPDYFI